MAKEVLRFFFNPVILSLPSISYCQ